MSTPTTSTTRATLISPTEVLGKRLLQDLETSEESLESLLLSLRQTAHPTRTRTGLAPLDHLWTKHSPSNSSSNSKSKLTIASRAPPLIYHLINTLVSAPHHGTVVVLDLDGRFSASHLRLLPVELAHVHVFRPTRANLDVTVAGLEAYMTGGEHGSMGREWRGVFVNGSVAGGAGAGSGTGGGGGGGLGLGGNGNGSGIGGIGASVKGTDVLVQSAWRGWLRVDREEVGLFAEGIAVEEAWAERERRQEVVEGRAWRGVSDAGEFSWREG